MEQPFLISENSKEEVVSVEYRILDVGKDPNIHWHDLLELEIILEGSGTHQYNGKTLPLKRGDVTLMTCYDFHTIAPTTQMKLLHITFPESSILEEIALTVSNMAGQLTCRFSEEETQYHEMRALLLEKEIKQKPSFSEILVQGILCEAVSAVLRKCLPENNEQLLTPQVQRASAYIHKHFRENILLSDVAAYLGMSAHYCGNLFQRAFGTSFNNYLLQVRLKYACQMLSATNMSVAVIAQTVGFSTTEYFFISFKKVFGISPSAYRTKSSKA